MVQEERLKASLFFAFALLPLSLLGLGFTIQFFKGVGGLVLAIIFVFLSSLAVRSCFSILGDLAKIEPSAVGHHPC